MAASKPCDVPPTPDELVSAQRARDLEMAHAERDNAVRLANMFALHVEQTGGYLSPEMQVALHEVRVLAEKRGLRERKLRRPWVNRE